MKQEAFQAPISWSFRLIARTCCVDDPNPAFDGRELECEARWEVLEVGGCIDAGGSDVVGGIGLRVLRSSRLDLERRSLAVLDRSLVQM